MILCTGSHSWLPLFCNPSRHMGLSEIAAILFSIQKKILFHEHCHCPHKSKANLLNMRSFGSPGTWWTVLWMMSLPVMTSCKWVPKDSHSKWWVLMLKFEQYCKRMQGQMSCHKYKLSLADLKLDCSILVFRFSSINREGFSAELKYTMSIIWCFNSHYDVRCNT